MVVGLILEANPYHNGHKYLVNQAKLKFPDSPIIAITSTSFTMRGEISLLDKFQKTKILLRRIIIEISLWQHRRTKLESCVYILTLRLLR